MELVRAEGWTLVNIDSTIVAERPKIGPHMKAIRESVARTLVIDIERESVKAKTNEKMDAVGREEGMASYAVALLMKTPQG